MHFDLETWFFLVFSLPFWAILDVLVGEFCPLTPRKWLVTPCSSDPWHILKTSESCYNVCMFFVYCIANPFYLAVMTCFSFLSIRKLLIESCLFPCCITSTVKYKNSKVTWLACPLSIKHNPWNYPNIEILHPLRYWYYLLKLPKLSRKVLVIAEIN